MDMRWFKTLFRDGIMDYVPASYIAIFSISLLTVAVLLVVSLEYWSKIQSRHSNESIEIDEKDTSLGDIHYKEWQIKNIGQYPIRITRLNLLVDELEISMDQLHLIRSVFSFDQNIAFIEGDVKNKSIILPGEQQTLMAVQFKTILNSNKFTNIFSKFDWIYSYKI